MSCDCEGLPCLRAPSSWQTGVHLSDAQRIDPADIEGTNINPTSFLATDYLNHFNEVIMLIEMLPDMPDCLADVVEWKPASYTEHFLRSGFRDAELTVRAYHAAPAPIRHRFDSLVADITVSVIEVIKEVERLITTGKQDALPLIVNSQVRDLRSMVDEASGIINNSTRHHAHDDELFDTSSDAQNEIDAILNA